MSAAQHTPGPILPLYYVRHPDGSYSPANPQPTPEQIAQQDGTYALCDGKHGGSACTDPHCYLPRVNAHDELVAMQKKHLDTLFEVAQSLANESVPAGVRVEFAKREVALVCQELIAIAKATVVADCGEAGHAEGRCGNAQCLRAAGSAA